MHLSSFPSLRKEQRESLRVELEKNKFPWSQIPAFREGIEGITKGFAYQRHDISASILLPSRIQTHSADSDNSWRTFSRGKQEKGLKLGAAQL